jgi:hypothetical protein
MKTTLVKAGAPDASPPAMFPRTRYINEARCRRNNRMNPAAFDLLLRQGIMAEANNAWRVDYATF